MNNLKITLLSISVLFFLGVSQQIPYLSRHDSLAQAEGVIYQTKQEFWQQEQKRKQLLENRAELERDLQEAKKEKKPAHYIQSTQKVLDSINNRLSNIPQNVFSFDLSRAGNKSDALKIVEMTNATRDAFYKNWLKREPPRFYESPIGISIGLSPFGRGSGKTDSYKNKIAYCTIQARDADECQQYINHELTHAILTKELGAGGFPIFLEEGIATNLGDDPYAFKRTAYWYVLGGDSPVGNAKDILNLEKMDERNYEEYKDAYFLVNFLLSQGKPSQVIDLGKNYLTMKDWDKAVRAAYPKYRNVVELNTAFRSWVTKAIKEEFNLK